MKTPILNEDGISVKGCKYIYAPKGKALEYAKLAANLYKQCPHACAYCYVANVLRKTRKEFHSGAMARENIINLITADADKYKALGITEQVLLSFTCDPYNVGYSNDVTRQAIINIKFAGMAVCTLSKGGSAAIRDIGLFRPDRDSYAATLTSLDENFSRKWEPNAAPPNDRIATLYEFHQRGIFTWVSLEPTLDTAASIAIIERTHEFVDLYKIGRANYLPMTKTTDWKAYTEKILETVNRLGVKHYIKHDLQQYLPEGYSNIQHIPQHH